MPGQIRDLQETMQVATTGFRATIDADSGEVKADSDQRLRTTGADFRFLINVFAIPTSFFIRI